MIEEDDDARMRKEAIARNPLPDADELFHYTGRVDEENLLRMIGGELFYFSNPKHFNDPNEFRNPIVQKKSDEKSPYFPILATGASGNIEFINALNQPIFSEGLTNIYNHRPDDLFDQVRVMCLTASSDANLMWSHYSDSHKGIVLGFDWRKLPRPVFRVQYKNELSLSEFGAGVFGWEVDQRFRTKATEWSYEKEWRIFDYTTDAAQSVFVSLRDALSSITFGSQTSAAVRTRVLELANRYRPNLKVRQSEFAKGAFKVRELKRLKLSPGDGEGSITAQLSDIRALLNVAPQQAIDALTQLGCEFSNDQANSVLELSVWSCLFVGDLDSFNSLIEPFLAYLYKIEESPFWPAAIAATCITPNSLLLERTKRWAPKKYCAQITHSERLDVTAKVSEIDIFKWWFLYARDKNNFVSIEAATRDERVFEQSAEKLFLKIGWKLATYIHSCKGSPLAPDLQQICYVNLRVAERIGNTHDIDACKQMLLAVDVPSI